jgi:hypothetical protein
LKVSIHLFIGDLSFQLLFVHGELDFLLLSSDLLFGLICVCDEADYACDGDDFSISRYVLHLLPGSLDIR